MNKMPSEQSPNSNDELAAEYCFDYRKAKPNRFASASEESQLKVVVLDDDVAQVFKTPESVNRVLRALIETMPNSAGGETA